MLGHELAHANLGHLDKQWLNQVLGWAGGAAIDAGLVLGGISTGGVFARQFARAGERAFSVNFEREADYVGAYYAARAGYELTGAEKFWRAFSLESLDAISNCQNVSGDACAFRTNAENRCRDRGQTAAQRSTGP
ncbi:MAG: M48 family metalloprotease [Pseudolabrys sp.]